MNSFAVITDLHFGVKNNSSVFLNSQIRYFEEEFIPELNKRNIKDIVIAGDIFDNRNSINIKIQNAVIDLFNRMNYYIYMIVGNHDLFHSDSNNVYSTKFFNKFEHIEVISNFSAKVIHGVRCILFPWMNGIEIIDIINKNSEGWHNSGYQTCIGHFDIKGFKMYSRNPPSIDGLPAELFYNNFLQTISGHFHTRSEQFNHDSRHKIIYPGSPYQLTRNDAGDFKGFGIFNFEDQKLISVDWIDSKNTIKYVQVVYPDETFVVENHIKGNIVDILVDYSLKYDETKLLEYKRKVESFNPAEKPEIKIINKTKINVVEEVNKNVYSSTSKLIGEYIDFCNFIKLEDKPAVLDELNKLYAKVGVD